MSSAPRTVASADPSLSFGGEAVAQPADTMPIKTAVPSRTYFMVFLPDPRPQWPTMSHFRATSFGSVDHGDRRQRGQAIHRVARAFVASLRPPTQAPPHHPLRSIH